MLLRSSSTPILGSLLSSYSNSPNKSEHSRCPSSDHQFKKVSFHNFSFNAPNMSSPSNISSGFRRVRSDGNLESLSATSELDELHFSGEAKPAGRRQPVLETILSFTAERSINAEDDEEEEEDGGGDGLLRSVTIGEKIFAAAGVDYGMGGLMDPVMEEEGLLTLNGMTAPPLFVAAGLGSERSIIGAASLVASGDGHGAGGGSFRPVDFVGMGDGSDLEDHYKRMVEENPCSALCLRNYAQFLHQVKMDYPRAEDFYSRAILAEPGDGEVLSQYAKLIWDCYHDHDRAASYFEQAVQASPDDSHVLSAYASFLWEAEEEEDDGGGQFEQLRGGFMKTQNLSGSVASSNV